MEKSFFQTTPIACAQIWFRRWQLVSEEFASGKAAFNRPRTSWCLVAKRDACSIQEIISAPCRAISSIRQMFTANVSRQLFRANVDGKMFTRKRCNPYAPSRTRFSNGLARKKLNMSMNNSHIGFFHTKFLRCDFPYMSAVHESC